MQRLHQGCNRKDAVKIIKSQINRQCFREVLSVFILRDILQVLHSAVRCYIIKSMRMTENGKCAIVLSKYTVYITETN